MDICILPYVNVLVAITIWQVGHAVVCLELAVSASALGAPFCDILGESTC